jgi:hypothetical protein
MFQHFGALWSSLQGVAMGRGISITANSAARFYTRPRVVFLDSVDMLKCVIAIGNRNPSNELAADFIAVVKRVAANHNQAVD